MRRLLLGLILLVLLFLVFYAATGFVNTVLSNLPPSEWDIDAVRTQVIFILWFICFLLGLAVVIEAATS